MSKLFPLVSWGQGTNVYEMNTRQYTAEGNFQALLPHIPRLKEMGVEIIWMMPVTPISLKGRLGTLGSYYACSNYTTINPEYGDENDFRQLVNAVHSLGMKIIIDWVANHTGQDHEWTQSHPEYYEKDAQGNFVEKNGWIDVVDLDYSNMDMRNAMITSMKFWVDHFDIDGFRCDMAHLVPISFWQSARTECDKSKPLFWMAECDDNQYLDVFDANYAWRWMHATNDMSKSSNTDLSPIYPLLNEDLQLLPDACKLWFTSNHDENSWNGSEYEKYGRLAKTWAVFATLFPGIPLIYSGQELPNLKRLAFFEKDQIEWTQEKPKLHEFYKSLLELRKSNTCFHTDIHCKILNTNSPYILAFKLQQGNDQVIVLLNFSQDQTQIANITGEQLEGHYQSLFSGLQYKFQTDEQFEIDPTGYLVYVRSD
ncbi:MAG: 1,4-alpha-glucan branching protein [Pseudopedobacter saltans]|uniref:1,4-alpha-glucan branching protein n=1 Tax=Pseudopedobacter saltans TaxID=151895 RepID=A0A2W5E8X3_9SPHI|nr:MAG: 1,4-alpha-glucan branching protein [Pseudopedobacter saltans]